MKPNKVLTVYGPRQVGKTTLVRTLLENDSMRIKYDTGDDYSIQEIWDSRNLSLLKEYVHGYDVVIIDEAQRIPGIGMGLKLLIDARVPCSLLVTGSSSFGLAGQIGEPLTGRKTTLMLFPVAQIELGRIFNKVDLEQQLFKYLVYGSYPEVVTSGTDGEKTDVLNEIAGSYLLKDILELKRVKSAKVLLDLLRLLAFQIGNEVSLRELGGSLGIDYKTVARYIDIMEKSFILFNVRGFSGNLRKEVTKKSKYYFFDNGVRNAIIANFNSPDTRDDVGALWENFIFMERMKKCAYHKIRCNLFFWRTWDKQEIDYIEERDGGLFAFEFKYGNKNHPPPKAWETAYPSADYSVINSNNYLDFIR
jgi:predicted AAA+ superfamily ATPase